MPSTISPPVVLGVQRPRLLHVPPHAELGDDSAGALAIELAASAGLFLDEWQRLVLENALSVREDGKWAAREVGLVVPRQCGKGSILEALELFLLFLTVDGPPPLILHSAHEYKTADEHFRRMRDLVDASDRLRKQVRIVRTASGAQSIEVHSGARLRFVTRTSGSGRGFSADTIVIDEAYNLTDEAMAAVLPTLSARPNPQVWYTSSAGMLTSDVLARVRSRGRSGTDAQLAYFEWSADDDADLDDVGAWAQANPALGIRIPLDAVRGERAAMSDEQFARERLGMWAEVTSTTVLDSEVWRALTDEESAPVDPVAFAVDVAPDRSSASIAVAGDRSDGLSHVEVVQVGRGTAWVVPRLVELVARWGPMSVVVDPGSPAGSLLPALADAHVDVRLTTSRDVGQAFGMLLDAVAAGELRHLGQSQVDRAIAGAKRRPLGEAWAWDRRSHDTDLTPLVALTLALWGLRAGRGAVFDVCGAVW